MPCIKCQKHHRIKKKNNHKETIHMRYRAGMGEEPNPVHMKQKNPKKQELKSSSPVKVNTALIVILQRPIGVKMQDRNSVQFSSV